MSYSDQKKTFSPASLGTVIAVHVGIGYALISGLAYNVVHMGTPVTLVDQIPEDQAPPPKMLPPPTQKTTPPPTATSRIVEVPLVTTSTIAVSDLPPVRAIPDALPPALTQAQSRPAASLARGAEPQGNKSEWVTTDDYPAAALRAETEGTTGIDVTIGANGRVTDCRVIASSGSDVLDQATCRTYARRAHFRPALDEAGQPIATHRADRVRWEIPR